MNGYLMSKDTEVLHFENDAAVEVINNKLMPLYFRSSADVRAWVESRAIDESRANARSVKRAMGVPLYGDFEAAMRVHAATITDTFWIKEDGESINWEDVRFHENKLAELALTGKDFDAIFRKDIDKTPELTNIGNREKCWALEGDTWYLYKRETADEVFSEMFISALGKALGFKMADYYPVDAVTCKTPCFLSESESFEPMWGIAVDHEEDGRKVVDEDYAYNLDLILELLPEAAGDYLNMIYLDVLCMNADRHTKNYGFIRDKETGELLSFAPNFDNNIALLYFKEHLVNKADDPMDGQVGLLAKLFRERDIEYAPPRIDEALVDEVLNSMPMEPSISRETIKRFILNRSAVINREIKK